MCVSFSCDDLSLFVYEIFFKHFFRMYIIFLRMYNFYLIILKLVKKNVIILKYRMCYNFNLGGELF